MAIVLDPDAVRAATESLMDARLRVGGFGSGAGGTKVEHFQDGAQATTPSLTRATEVCTRQAERVASRWSAATDANAADMVEVAALRSAIELEASHFPDQVESDRSPARFWLDLLGDAVEELDAVLGSPSEPVGADAGGPGLDAVWSAGVVGALRAEGSECPVPFSSVPGGLVW